MANFNDLINKSDIPVLVDFHADWCQPCHILAPIIKEVANDFADDLKVLKVNIDKNKKAAIKFQIKSIPTLILFYKGKILWRSSGVMKKNQLISQLTPHIKNKAKA